MTSRKRQLGQFFTKRGSWLKPQIIDFIRSSKASIAVDPFAGAGDLLEAAKSIGIVEGVGFDIDRRLGWKKNDSLVTIPKIKRAILITNPPFLTNYSAKRKHLLKKVSKYFNASTYTDLYQIALDRSLANYEYVVAIVPETFINSSFPKTRVRSITIIEDSLFDDTDCPVGVVCFDGNIRSINSIKIYKNEKFIADFGEILSKQIPPQGAVPITFNVLKGNIALRAVDSPNPRKPIAFLPVEELDYDLKGIKYSSRLITIVRVLGLSHAQTKKMIGEANEIVRNFRVSTHDVLLSPFKGNNKDGIRRRRLDYETARGVLELAYFRVISQRGFQKSLFEQRTHAYA